MDQTASEKATINFYEWEQRGRGYYHFDEPVNIEPPYVPFYFKTLSSDEKIDDGKQVSLFKRVSQFLGNGNNEIVEKDEETILEPTPLTRLTNLEGFSISFPKGQDISNAISFEFLNMLSFTSESLSFEIIGSQENITIQFVCDESDLKRIQSHFKAYFPNAVFKDVLLTENEIGFESNSNVAIADFGYSNEFMLPVYSATSFNIDPLTSIIATLDNLDFGDTAMFQVIFKGTLSPWSKDIPYAVSDGHGGSFFANSPEMLPSSKEKVSAPLFSVVMRIATQGNTDERSRYLASELVRSITSISTSQNNKLIPLSNEGYNYDFHLQNIYNRTSNRLGMILNSKELVSFVHYPNKTIVSQKLNPQTGKTKLLPKECLNQKYVLGINTHNGIENTASIDDKTFGKHIVLGGSTGTGKTHLLKQLISFDIELQNSTFVIDPHGDLVQDLLNTIPDDKKDNVVYINIADEDYSFGFNIFEATTEAEKTVLASDLASAFADTWISSGDRIQSVLQKTISTLIYSEKDTSILDMKRFLLEKDFRNEFVSTLDDPILEYYWQNEFPLVRRNELSPLLLRIDSFMQTRLLRNIFCQTKGIDFKELIEEKKLVLIQLSVGLIGLENSKFLARLIIAKINQIAFSRQKLDINKRQPIHLYIDEAHNYANSPVIEQILSGARKYNLSLVLVLQHLEQVQNNLLNSILTNTATQIFFRQSDKDSKRISSSYSYFEAEDFMELDLGEALVRVNKRSNDFNLKTLLSKTDIGNYKDYIIDISRQKYAQSKEHIQELLATLLPKNVSNKKPSKLQDVKKEISKNETTTNVDLNVISEKEKQKIIERDEKSKRKKEHTYLQTTIKKLGQQYGFLATIEKETASGGRIDVALVKESLRIACEISVTNKPEYELENIKKCLADNYHLVLMISNNNKHLNKIKELTKTKLSKQNFEQIYFIDPDQVSEFLNISAQPKSKTEVIKGFRVTTEYEAQEGNSFKSIRESITRILMKNRK